MIASGEKKEEYREVKDYWMKRLAGLDGCGSSYNFTILCNHKNRCKEFDYVIFKNGYAKNAPVLKVECKGIEVKEGNKKWGAPNYRVFAIKLGKIVEQKGAGEDE